MPTEIGVLVPPNSQTRAVGATPSPCGSRLPAARASVARFRAGSADGVNDNAAFGIFVIPVAPRPVERVTDGRHSRTKPFVGISHVDDHRIAHDRRSSGANGRRW